MSETYALDAPRMGRPPTSRDDRAEAPAIAQGQAPRQEAPAVLVVGIFPPMPGREATANAAHVAALLEAGYAVETLSLWGHGDAHRQVAFDRAHGLRATYGALASRRFAAVHLNLAGVALRRPDRWARRGVLALQVLFLLWLGTRGDAAVLGPGQVKGIWPIPRLLRGVLGGITRLRRLFGGHTRASCSAATGAGPIDTDHGLAEGGEDRFAAWCDRLGRLAALVPDAGGACAPATLAPALGKVVEAAEPARARRWREAASTLNRPPNEGDADPGLQRLRQAVLAPDPAWSTADCPVPAWMAHLRAWRRALPELEPGDPLAARRLRSWAQTTLSGDTTLAAMAAGIAAARAAPGSGGAMTGERALSDAALYTAWWSALAQAGGFARPLERSGAPARAGPPLPTALPARSEGALETGLVAVFDHLAAGTASTACQATELALPTAARQALSARIDLPTGGAPREGAAAAPPTGLSLALALMAGDPVVRLDPAARHRLARLGAQGKRRHPALADMFGDGPEPPAEASPIALIGHGNPHTGLGANLVMTARSLQAAGLAVRTRSIDNGLAAAMPLGAAPSSVPEGCRPDRTARGATCTDPGRRAVSPREVAPGGWTSRHRRQRRPAAILHLNADRLVEGMLHPGLTALLTAPEGLQAPPARIGFLLWEFGVLPDAHRLAPAMLEEIWCPTRFVAEAYEQARRPGDAPVQTVGKALFDPPPPVGDRACFGLPPEAFVFLMVFDFHASVERKNPLALARAFLDAFGPGPGSPLLVIKTTDPVKGHRGDPHDQWRSLQRLAANDPRLHLMTGRWTAERLSGLMSQADCLVSPHRAEGFGYAPAEAMLRGLPVVATDYSGTTDFLTEATGWPVPARHVPVAPGEALYDMPGAVWAEIEHDALVETLRTVRRESATRQARAAAAQRLMRDRYGPAAHTGRLLARLDALGVTVPA
ncbi:MAG: glycosyltransferase family 4 protein [Pseudomonadota bacterium]